MATFSLGQRRRGNIAPDGGITPGVGMEPSPGERSYPERIGEGTAFGMGGDDGGHICRYQLRDRGICTSTPRPRDRNERGGQNEFEGLADVSGIFRQRLAFIREIDDEDDAENDQNLQRKKKPRPNNADEIRDERNARGPEKHDVDGCDGFAETRAGQTYCERVRGTRRRAGMREQAGRAGPNSSEYMDERQPKSNVNKENLVISLEDTASRDIVSRDMNKSVSGVDGARTDGTKLVGVMGLTEREKELMREEEELEKEVKRRYIWALGMEAA